MRAELPKTYDPHQVEPQRYAWWMERGDFYATIADDGRPRYCITIPPPNITGSLHMGHALNNSIHDVLLRWKRMQGYNVLCVPGTDHAGIATQNVVERELRKEGLTRHQLGREKFLERVWQWREQYGNTILMQFRRLGCSYDWRYTRFTLDPEYVDAVLEVFVRWWQDGHLYIGERVINWCPRCMTALSDIELEQADEPGKLYHLRYPFEDGSGYVVVATTRPETMLGDVAVAVNPSDARYTQLIGKNLILPLVGRRIPLIADPYPDPEFGTGAVKVTPAHDPNDFEIGQRHNLPRPLIMNLDGTINTERLREELNAHDNPYLQAYHGKDRYEVRKLIVADLEAGGYLEKVEDYTVPLARCERCHTVIEPLLSEQWFCRMTEIAKPAIEVVKQGKIRFIPERYTEMYLNWMENIRDWCISRQLWWGHQIPAWYCVDCNPENFERTEKGEYRLLKRENPIVQKTAPDKCPRCGSMLLVRDPDVLDTWFSSAIWPHTVLGWPRDTEELRLFYPTDVLITAQEILYLWVARMIMTGLYFKGDIPFREVYIHATVLNKEGKRMSKSLGTGIDPLEMIEKYGTDALRWSLLQQAGMQQSIRFYEERVVNARNFANKVWNATRFVLLNLEDADLGALRAMGPQPADTLDRWILSRLQRTIQAVHEALGAYCFDDGANALYEFIWSEVCDWYIEAVKPRLQEPLRRTQTQAMLVYLFDQLLRLLHPYMPHITEELWQAIGATEIEPALIRARFPQANPAWIDEAAEAEVAQVFEVIRAIRNLRAEVKITPGVAIPKAWVNPLDEESRRRFEAHRATIAHLAWCQHIAFGVPDERALMNPATGAEVFLPIAGLVDIERERERLQKELQKVEQEIKQVQARLRNPQFLERAKPEVVQEAREQERELLERHRRLQQRIEQLSS
ncbi:MAG: valine--tRNA ligase [Armatimonadetes bacterium]|jgi:valyl-tRNA synthetase|nr:valine--tRNA ligase [Armatimonadota bacterium]CUU11374.1 valyl-tRNA synthetase [Armatimonadetes bacterium GBS]CUU36002.1 valyl-tRNA synthetase [Armatimonadetes bacterium DC]CUU38714.1 valyl-tRNA synthetase [Armatimonadetes bacterium GXS]GBC90660.1 Valine--tRNA ligase [bacterium HR14]GIV12615.1 MAG: valine--tRNA ligase [Fimbriimonadales bacterium]